MIQDGDLFNVYDLKSSVEQATSADVAACAVGCKNQLLKFSPEQYADVNIGLYNDIKSSAVALDGQLRQNGFKTAYKFSYDYRLGGLSYDQIVRDAYKLEYFYKLAISEVPKFVQNKGKNRTEWKNLTRILDDAARVSYYYAQYIWACNPDSKFDYLTRFDVRQHWGFIICFLLGVGFQFHPKDVYEFVVHHNDVSLTQAGRDALYSQQSAFKSWCMKNYGIDTGCLVLCPEHQEKLRKILTRTDTPYFIQKIQQFVRSGVLTNSR